MGPSPNSSCPSQVCGKLREYHIHVSVGISPVLRINTRSSSHGDHGQWEGSHSRPGHLLYLWGHPSHNHSDRSACSQKPPLPRSSEHRDVSTIFFLGSENASDGSSWSLTLNTHKLLHADLTKVSASKLSRKLQGLGYRVQSPVSAVTTEEACA